MKLLSRFFPVLLWMACSTGAFAQLSGTYTIGGTSPNYATFAAAVSDLLSKGVSGPVTFNARSGTYNEGSISFNAVTGASASNTITFQSESGNVSDVTLQAAITFNTASYITLNTMTIGPAGIVINLLGKSNYVNITNNVLNGAVVNAFGSDVIQAIGYTGTGLVISGNTINNGSEGICLYGTDNSPQNIITNSIIRNNVIQNFYGWGICANNQRGTSIDGNTISSAPTSGYGSIAIYIQNISYPICVTRNKITLTGTNYAIAGMYIVNNHPDSLSEGSTISNNMISVQNGNGFYLINNDYFSFYYNTINITSSGTCFQVGGNSTGNVLADNIFYQAAIQNVISVEAGAVSSSDYNDIYTTSTTFGYWNGSSCSSLATWRSASGMDTHSVFIPPAFVSNTDLHLTDFLPLQMGTPISNITYDIDLDNRNSTPAVGADDNGAYNGNPPQCCACLAQLTTAFAGTPLSLCVGDSVSFTDQSTGGATAWRWTFAGGIPHSSILKNPVVYYDTAGTYPVKLVVTGASSADSLTKTAYITVNATPVAGTVSASPDSVCPGATSQLTVTGNTGTVQWQSSTDGASFADISLANSTSYNTPAVTQTTYYRVETTSLCGTDSSAAVPVTVVALPATGYITAVPDSVCPGNTATITLTGSGGTIQWQSSADGSNYTNSQPDSTSFTTAALNATSYYRAVINNSICADTSAAVWVGVWPATVTPTVSTNDSLICSSDSARITSSPAYASYHWNNGDTTGSIYTGTAGGYWVSVTDNNGCTAVSGHQQITVYPVPSVSIELQGDTLASFNYDHYQWFYNDTAITGATASVYVAHQTGEYAVQIIDTNNCPQLSQNTLVTVDTTTGLPTLSRENISVYPNPSSGSWQLAVDNSLVGSALEVYDEQGRVVFNSKLRTPNSKLELNVPAGNYYLRIKTSGGEYVRKLVKE